MKHCLHVCLAGEAITLNTDHALANNAAVTGDSMFSPLAGNGQSGRVVFSTQESAKVEAPQHSTGNTQSKWCRIDVWQQKL